MINWTTKIPLFAIIIIATLVQITHNASLTAIEQKKYKQFLEGQGLYSADDDVEVLTIDNFKNTIMGSRQAHLVEFYNSWCGFCQRFAPSWKALATDIKGWRDLVRVSALDCADEDNFPVCREYEIMGYPTLRYFHENYVEGPKNLGLTVTKGDDVNSHRKNLIEVMIAEQSEGRGSVYPPILAYNKTDLADLFHNDDGKYAFLLEDQFLGVEVALDLHKTPVTIRYTYPNNTQLINLLNLKSSSMAVIDRATRQFEVMSINLSRDSVKKVIIDYLIAHNVKVTDDTPVNADIFRGKWVDAEVPDMEALMAERVRRTLQEKVKKMGDVVFQMDLETAMRYSLKHEVGSLKTIEGEHLTALRAYVKVLVKYFPFGDKGQVFIHRLDTLLQQNSVRGGDVVSLVETAEAEGDVFSSPPHWLGCRGSTQSFRGYPCGLWKLFHYLTVQAAEGSGHPREVLDAMLGYISRYFGCADCAQHFVAMTVEKDMASVASHNSAILWLWMAHNSANKRLAGDRTEDPEYPKLQFPSKERCSPCRNSDDTWDLTEVLKYMKNMYGSHNVRYLGADSKILNKGLEVGVRSGMTESSTSGGLFEGLDISMCFILYVLSFFLLALLIRVFLLKRGYRKKPYAHDLLGKV